MQIGIAAYLRNLAVRSNRVAKGCTDAKTKSEIEKICAELTEKAEAIESLFEISNAMK
ncbi:MAG TPA: hypothetical protein VFX37_01620 [Pseudolabrys sp.]|nr:hypothetical protein [Pseudolabrys sp.]